MSRKSPTYGECHAYIVLREVIGLTNIELSDKPDLIDHKNSVGIEVVNAIPKDILHVANMYMKKECHYISLEQINDIISKRGYSPEYSVNEHFKARTATKDEIYEILDERIDEKCNKKRGYEKVDEYRLYLNTLIGAPYDLDDFINKVTSLYQKCKDVFHTLYFHIENENTVIIINDSGVSRKTIENHEQLMAEAKKLWKSLREQKKD